MRRQINQDVQTLWGWGNPFNKRETMAPSQPATWHKWSHGAWKGTYTLPNRLKSIPNLTTFWISVLIPAGTYNPHTSPKKLRFQQTTANQNTECWCSIPADTATVHLLHLRLRGHSRVGTEHLEEPEKQELYWELISRNVREATSGRLIDTAA